MQHNFQKSLISVFSCIAVSMVALSATAQAQDWEVEGNLAATTDYVWRGVSQNDESLAISGGLDASKGLFYVGTWASQVDFGDDANIEVDIYAGFAGEFGNGLAWDVGIIHYMYPSEDDLNFTEVYGGIGYEFENGFEAGGYVYRDLDNELTYVEVTGAKSLENGFSLSGAIGQYEPDDGEGYTNYNIGVTKEFEHFDADVRFHTTSEDEFDNGDERIVFTLAKSFDLSK